MGEDVAADGLGRVAPHGVRLGVHLVGDKHECVVDVGEFLQVLQVAVELLLASGEHASSNELGTEVAGQRIDDDHLDVQSLAHSLDFIGQEHLVSGVVRTGDVNAGEDIIRVQSVSAVHLCDALRSECVFRVDVEDIAVEATLVDREGAVHGELVPNLGLSATEFTVDLHQSLGLESTTEEVVD